MVSNSRIGETQPISKIFKIMNDEQKITRKPSLVNYKTNLWKLFKKNFQTITGKTFEENKFTCQNLSALFYYFLQDEAFYTHENIIKTESHPSLHKGLLIIGGYGCGKTSYMEAIEVSLKQLKLPAFKTYSTNQVVLEYESCCTQQDKKSFYEKYTNGILFFDDLMSEHKANNFGHIEIMKDIIEMRYNNRKPTFISANYDDHFAGDINQALLKIGNRYGPRVYDRLFEMFNILQFNGKSLRH